MGEHVSTETRDSRDIPEGAVADVGEVVSFENAVEDVA